MDSLQDFLSVAIQALIVLAIPILVGALVPWIVQRYREARQRFGAEQLRMIENGFSIAVRAAEQAGLSGQIAAVGREKKAYALAMMQGYVDRLGIKINVDEVSEILEAEVHRQFHAAATQQGPLPGSGRENLIEKAIDTAVLAVQRGDFQALLSDLRAGLDEQKAASAVRFVQKYLGQYQLSLDPEVAEGLLQAHLMRLKMQALHARG